MRPVAFFFFFAFILSAPVDARAPEIRNLSNRRYFDETLAAIQNARQSIFLAMYHAPLDPSNRASPVTRLVEALIEAKARGVAVRVILDQAIKSDRSRRGAPMKNLRVYHVLKENGVLVSFDSLAKRTHAKLLVIDHEIVILGSTNWSREALDQNYEANLWVRSPETARTVLEDFQSIELLGPEKAMAPGEFFRIPRDFLLDKNQGPRLLDEHEERALRVYLILLSSVQEHVIPASARNRTDPSFGGKAGIQRPGSPTHFRRRMSSSSRKVLRALSASVNTFGDDSSMKRGQAPKVPVPFSFEEAAKLLGMKPMSREATRRQIIKVLKKLDRDYKLIHFKPRHGKEAIVALLDPTRQGGPYRIPEENYFELPRGLFSGGWLGSLSMRAVYALLILYDQHSYPRTSLAMEVGLETLEKRYSASRKTLGDGLRELARRNLVEIYYGKTIDFKKREFETASYVLLPFYDPPAREEKLRQLEALYGRDAFREARRHAAAFFKENDPAVIETLLGLRLTYSPAWVNLAMKKVILEKDVGNPARSLPYLIGILKQWKEKGRPVFIS